MDRLLKFCLPLDLQTWLKQYQAPQCESAFAKDIPNSLYNHKWRVDWPRSLRSERSIVEDLGVDTEDLLHSAIEASQIGSPYTKDNFGWHYM